MKKNASRPGARPHHAPAAPTPAACNNTNSVQFVPPAFHHVRWGEHTRKEEKRHRPILASAILASTLRLAHCLCAIAYRSTCVRLRAFAVYCPPPPPHPHATLPPTPPTAGTPGGEREVEREREGGGRERERERERGGARAARGGDCGEPTHVCVRALRSGLLVRRVAGDHLEEGRYDLGAPKELESRHKHVSDTKGDWKVDRRAARGRTGALLGED